MFINTIYLLIAAPIGIFIGFSIFQVGVSYGGISSTIIQSELSYFSIILLSALLFIKNFSWIGLALICLCMNLITSGRGGEILIFILGIMVFFVLLYTRKKTFLNKRRKRVLKTLLYMRGILTIVYFPSIEFSALTQIKFRQVISLFNVFTDLRSIASSPFVRVAEVFNVLHNGISNPFFLVFGHGYGGYFTDSLGLFRGIDLSMGAYAPDAIIRQQFPRPHGAVPCTLLCNGLIGLFLIVRLGLKYVKKIEGNFLAFAGIILFFYGLYFNNLLAITSVFVIFASEHKIDLYSGLKENREDA
jgi:hypothetical protein